MKIKPKQYAIALLEALEGKNKEKAKAVIEKTAAAIIRNNDQSKVSEIVSYFIAFKNKTNGVVVSEIASARELSKESVDELKDYIKKETGAKEVEIETKTDEKILGGVILKYGDKKVDASLISRIAQLKNNLNK